MSEETSNGPLSPELLAKMNAYWRAANYLSVGQIYLKDNPLLERPLTLDDVKPRLLGHWGTTPGLNFLYVHWNRRAARQSDFDVAKNLARFVPGHEGADSHSRHVHRLTIVEFQIGAAAARGHARQLDCRQ